jgi:hypothetical protein
MRNVLDKFCMGNQNRHFMPNNFFFPQNRANFEMMWKNVAEPETTKQNIMWCMRVTFRISWATGAHAHAHDYAPKTPRARAHTHTHTHTCAHARTHSRPHIVKYVTHLTVPLQQWFFERASLLALHVHCLPCVLCTSIPVNRITRSSYFFLHTAGRMVCKRTFYW